MVRLTSDLVLRSPQYFNAVKDRELDLRGNKIAVIENFGATEDLFDSVDLSDNEIVKLEGFPYLNRLSTLLVNNNRIARINPAIGANLPKLQTLVLSNNRLMNLADLDPLSSIPNLQRLSLLDNPVVKVPSYRLYVIHKLPKLRLLDFRKVKQKERIEAAALFKSKKIEEVAKPAPVKTFVPGEGLSTSPSNLEEPTRRAPTQEQLLAIKAAIQSAQTLEEVARLEKAFKTGQLPTDLKIADDSVVKMTSSGNNDNSSSRIVQPMETSSMKENENEAMEEG